MTTERPFRGATALVVLAFALAALPALPELPLRRASQARAWVVAREMAATGDWAVPRYHGDARLKKPPLQSWVQAAAMKVTGSDALPVAGFASWLTGLLFALGPLWIGTALGRPGAGFLGSLLLCATRSTLWWGASPEHDLPFAGVVAASLAALARALRADGRPSHAWTAGLCCGAAVLVKGPFAPAFVLGTALVAGWGPRGASSGVRRTTLWTALLVGTLLPVAAWLAVVTARLGSATAVADEVLRQATGAEGAHVKRGLAWLVYYVGTVAKWAMPWTPVAVLCGVFLARRRRRGEEVPRGPSLRFASIAVLVTFLVLTATPAKQEHYLLPILPPLFLIVGALVTDAAAVLSRGARWAPVLVAGIGAAFAASRVAAASDLSTTGLLVLELTFLALLVALALPAALRKPPALALAFAAFLAAAANGLAARRDAVRGLAEDDFRSDGARIEALARPGEALVGFAPGPGEAFDTLVAWVRRPYERVRDAPQLRDRIARDDAVVLVREIHLEELGEVRRLLARRLTASPPRPKHAKDRVEVLRAR